MEQWRKNVVLLWIAVFVASTVWAMIMPFLPLYLEQELGVTTGVSSWAGLMGAMGSAGMAVMAPIWGAMGDRYGRKMMMLRAGFFLSLSYVLMSLVTGPYGLMGVRLMIGMLTGFIPTALALVGTTTPQEHVGKALSAVSVASQAGNITGPLFGGLFADLIGMRPTMLLGAGAVATAALFVLLSVREQFTPVPKEQSNILRDMGQVLKNKAFAAILITTIIMAASQAAMEPILVPYLKGLLGRDAPNWMAGFIYSLPGIAFVVAAPWWASRGEKVGYATTVTIGLAGGALLILPQALVTGGWAMGALRLGAGLALAAVSPGISALITRVVPKAQRGRAFGMNQSAFSVGAMLGPLMGGFVGDLAGAVYVFPLTALLLVAATGWTRTVLNSRVRQAESTVA